MHTAADDKYWPKDLEWINLHQSKGVKVWGGLTNSCEKKRSEKQMRKGNIYPFECRIPKNSKEK